MFKTLVPILCFVLAFQGCKHEPLLPSEEEQGNGGVIISDDCDPDTVYFSNQILPLFQSSCAISGCHDAVTAEEGIVLDSYTNIMASGELTPFDLNDGDIYEVITESDPDDVMPPAPNSPLTSQQMQWIENWILQGAQNNGCEGCEFPIVSFSASVFPLVQNKCEGCHSGADPSGSTLITNYSEVKFLVDNDYFIEVMKWDPGYEPMPYNGNKLPQCEIDMIQQWLDDGAPNN